MPPTLTSAPTFDIEAVLASIDTMAARKPVAAQIVSIAKSDDTDARGLARVLAVVVLLGAVLVAAVAGGQVQDNAVYEAGHGVSSWRCGVFTQNSRVMREARRSLTGCDGLQAVAGD